MTEKEFREKYGMLKFQEMYERDEDKRKDISKQIKSLESTYKRSTIDSMLDNDKTNEESKEKTEGRSK